MNKQDEACTVEEIIRRLRLHPSAMGVLVASQLLEQLESDDAREDLITEMDRAVGGGDRW